MGNQAVNPYNSLGVTVLYQGILMNNAGSPAITSGFLPSSSLYNPALKWETSVSGNLGLDFSLLDNKISGSFEYYNTRTTDLLINKSLPNILGYTSQLVNLGEVKNSGFEAMVNIKPVKSQEIDWNVGLVFSRNRNKLVKIDGKVDAEGKPVNDLNNRWFIGESVNVAHRLEQMTRGLSAQLCLSQAFVDKLTDETRGDLGAVRDMVALKPQPIRGLRDRMVLWILARPALTPEADAPEPTPTIH